MRVFLASTGLPESASCIPRFREAASRNVNSRHSLVDDPSAADIILFTEAHLLGDWRLNAIRRHPLRRQYPERCYIYNEMDNPWAALPGLYVSYPASALRPECMAAAPYYSIPDTWTDQPQIEPDLLFSFVGTPTHPERERIYDLRHPRSHVVRSEGFVFYDAGSVVDFADRQSTYRDAVRRSRFVLCPRGAGLSSIRLYETMGAGRAPVILADDWAPPIGPDWGSFSIRWPVADIAALPAYLESREAEATGMGNRARLAYENWISPDVAFDHLVDRLEALVDSDAAGRFPTRGIHDARFLEVAASAARVWQGRKRRHAAAYLAQSLRSARG